MKLQSRTKYVEQNGTIQENWTGEKKLVSVFACFLTAIGKV